MSYGSSLSDMSLDLYPAHSQRREPADLPVVQVNIRIHPTVTTIRLVPISKLRHSTLQHHGSPLWLNSLPRPHQLSPRNPRAPRFFGAARRPCKSAAAVRKSTRTTPILSDRGEQARAASAGLCPPVRSRRRRAVMASTCVSWRTRSAASKFWRVRHPRHSRRQDRGRAGDRLRPIHASGQHSFICWARSGKDIRWVRFR